MMRADTANPNRFGGESWRFYWFLRGAVIIEARFSTRWVTLCPLPSNNSSSSLPTRASLRPASWKTLFHPRPNRKTPRSSLGNSSQSKQLTKFRFKKSIKGGPSR